MSMELTDVEGKYLDREQLKDIINDTNSAMTL